MGREDGFTLVELLAVMVIMGLLVSISVGFQMGARDRAEDATAKSNIRTATPAIEAYRTDTGSYAGMTEAGLRSQYSPGIKGIAIVSASDSTYCVSATAGDRTWYKAGASGPITTTACS